METRKKNHSALFVVLPIVVVLGGSVVAFQYFSKQSAKKNFESKVSLTENVRSGLKARVKPVLKSPSEKTLQIVGESRPLQSVVLYSKISGYIKEIRVERGDKVTAGQVIAVLDSPETERTYSAAVSEANFKSVVARRIKQLLKKKLTSPQEAEQASAEAEISRFRADAALTQRNYNLIRAPFDGKVTARFVDRGALVQSAINTQSAQPVVTVSNVDSLKIYAFVSQKDAPYVNSNTVAIISFPEKPGFELKSKVSRISGELDSKTKTLLVEIDVDNRSGQILAGGFVNVALILKTQSFLQIPVESLIVQKNRQFAPVIDGTNTLRMREIKVSENDGKNLTIIDGLKEGELVALNLGEGVSDGDFVTPIMPTIENSLNVKNVIAKEVIIPQRSPTGKPIDQMKDDEPIKGNKK